ncbi:hypothetical protein A4X13_0g7511, partial [Tilletia indica]
MEKEQAGGAYTSSGRRRPCGGRASATTSAGARTSRRSRTLLGSVSLFLVLLSLQVLLLPSTANAIKFELPAHHSSHQKCIWNYALSDTLVVVTINAVPSTSPDALTTTAPSDKDALMQLDIEIVDGSHHNNVYLSKKN